MSLKNRIAKLEAAKTEERLCYPLDYFYGKRMKPFYCDMHMRTLDDFYADYDHLVEDKAG